MRAQYIMLRQVDKGERMNHERPEPENACDYLLHHCYDSDCADYLWLGVYVYDVVALAEI
jgi:hypothetical protein